MGTQQAKGALAETVDGIDPLIRKIQTGEFERSLSALTAVEIFLGHQKAIRGCGHWWPPAPSEQCAAVAEALPPHGPEQCFLWRSTNIGLATCRQQRKGPIL